LGSWNIFVNMGVDNMVKYEALLVAPDGGFVTDFKRDTIEQVGRT